MSFSYDPGLGTRLDRIRFHTGDTKEMQPLLDDEEIEGAISLRPIDDDADAEEQRRGELLIAADAAEAIAAKFARESDTSIEGQRVGLSAKFDQYTKLAKRLRQQATEVGQALGGWVYTERW